MASQSSSWRRSEVGTARRVCNIINLYPVTRVDVGVDLDSFENPDIRFVMFDQDFVNDICLINRVEDVGHRLRSELCDTDEQHRMVLLNA